MQRRYLYTNNKLSVPYGREKKQTMNKLVKKINTFLYDDFIFSSRYRVWRHIFYWSFHTIVWAIFWTIMDSRSSFVRNVFNMSLWIPVFMLFGYPLVYMAVPRLLLKGKVWQFVLLILLWGVAGLYINAGFSTYLYVPLQQLMGFSYIPEKGFQPHYYLCMTTSVASPMIVKFFQLWTIRQKAWMLAQQEKITAQLQLLKAQLHPRFLLNTLNNIYSFALNNSSKTPQMVLRLSSLLSYMLYDCKAEEVLLEKEVEVMKNYIELEKERYGDKIDISMNIEGDIHDKYISPLLILPFLENAFKHGISEQLDRPWMSVDIAVKDHSLKCKIVNSKNEFVQFHDNGVGINNVKKRLEFLYPGKYDLKLADEGEFFVVSLLLELKWHFAALVSPMSTKQKIQKVFT
jgi:two-component system sensor histidine kinase AlgZ